jgi:hypothetical protein
MRTPLLIALTLVALGCGSSSNQNASAGTTGAGGAITTSSATTTSGAGGAGGVTTASGTGGGWVDGGPRALFDCGGCLCDGATHYCQVTQAGAHSGPGQGRPPAPPCDDADAGAPNGCIPLPSQCLNDVQCACIAPMPGPCSCMDLGPGLEILCALP